MSRTSLIGFVLGTLVLSLSACVQVSGPASQEVSQPVRTVQTLSDGWKFQFANLNNPPLEDNPDTHDWETVSVPHTWNRVGYYTNDLVPHINTDDNVDKRMGQSWYSLEFTGPDGTEPTRHWLEFDAVSRTAEVWLNGHRLGEHRGPFTRFRFDVTDYIKLGETNRLVVKADNSKPEPGSPTADVLPIAGDFFVHGGIYRPVRLVSTNEVHIALNDHGGPGVYASTTELRDNEADVSVRTLVSNDEDEARPVSLRVSLIDADGNTVATQLLDPSLLDAHQTAEFATVLTVPTPRLWQGTADPYLYTLRAEVTDQAGRELDLLDQPFGIRQITIDPDKGLFLNGRQTPLHGVAYHQDREGKGWAVSPEDVADDLDIMKEMGTNTIRLAHYPHGQPIHNLADKNGIILWDEIPLVSLWDFGADETETNLALKANAKLQLQELIHQNFNHPSVAVWGIANEVDFGSLLPAFIGDKSGRIPDPMPLLRDLAEIAAEEDPFRDSVLANCCDAVETMSDDKTPPVANVTDAYGVNRYYGWYYGDASQFGSQLDTLHAMRPDKPLSISEYGAGGAISLQTDDPTGGPPDSRGHNQPEGYFNLVHEKAWADISARPYIWASWVWNGFDFATTIRKEGDARDINTKGLVTYDRQVKKDAYYFYKANWSGTPTVYLVGRRYGDRAYAVTDVKVYSNAPETELIVNGVSMGPAASCIQSVCIWPQVRLAAGDNTLVAKGDFKDEEVSDEVTWSLAANLETSYNIDAGTLLAAHDDEKTFGSDTFFDGGTAESADEAGTWGKPAVTPDITGARNRLLDATYRSGDFTYELPLPQGKYKVTLIFMEPDLAPDERTFDVISNGQPVLRNFDIASAAGGPLREVQRTFSASVEDGPLSLQFQPVTGDAIVSAIMVSPE